MLATGGGTAGLGLSEVDKRIWAIMGTTAVASVPFAENMNTDQGPHLLNVLTHKFDLRVFVRSNPRQSTDL